MKCRSCRRSLGTSRLFCDKCGTLAAVRLSPEEVESLLKSSDDLLNSGHGAQARKLLEDLIEVEPTSASAFNQLGAVYLQTRKPQKADYCFKKALFLDGSLRAAIDNLKKLHTVRQHKLTAKEKALLAELEGARQSQGDEAVQAYRQILAANPKVIEAYNDLGLLYFQQGDHDEAEAILVRGLEEYYVGGMQVDHQYYNLKENLGKLRDAREDSVKGANRPTIDPLGPGEQSLATVAGDLRLARTGELRKHGMLVATNKRIVLLWPEPGTGEWKVETIPYESVRHVKINFGIVRAVMIVSTRTEELYFSTLSKDEAKTALTIVRSMMRKTSETSMVDDIIVKATDMSNKTAVLLLKALNELNVLTDDEYMYKVTAVERNGQPERPPALQPPPRRMRGTR